MNLKLATIIAILAVSYCTLSAQNVRYGNLKFETGTFNAKNIINYYIPLHKTIHIVSPEKINYADLSSEDAIGDLPTDNILRIKLNDSARNITTPFVVTIVTDYFIQSYRLIPRQDDPADSQDGTNYVIKINPEQSLQLNSLDKVSQQDFNSLAFKIMSQGRKIYNISSKDIGMEFWINNIFTFGDYILMDISARNNTKLTYHVNDLSFRIKDKRTTKSTAQQEIQIQPIFRLYNPEGIRIRKGNWRNIYLFDRFTYPDDKVLNVEMTEKELSGRKIDLDIDYNQLLKSDYIQ